MTDTTDLAAVWTSATDEVSETFGSAQQRAYLRLTRLSRIVDDTALVSVPDAYIRDMIESRMRPAITDALSRRLGRPIQVAVTVRPSEEGADKSAGAVPAAREPETLFDPEANWSAAPSGSAVAEHPVPPNFGDSSEMLLREATNAPERQRVGTGRDDRRAAASVTPDGNRLNPKYMFETFVIGSSNRFAHAAAVAVAESPAKAYYPLFIYGGSGLGKTHLLHAIGHYATSLGNARFVRYVSTEEFTNDFINSLRDDKTQAFRSEEHTSELQSH